MSAVLTPIDRLPFAAGDILWETGEKQTHGTATCIVYASGYTVHEGRVLLHVETSPFPNRVGNAQERRYERDGDRLSLSAVPLLRDGREQRALLVWKQAGRR